MHLNSYSISNWQAFTIGRLMCTEGIMVIENIVRKQKVNNEINKVTNKCQLNVFATSLGSLLSKEYYRQQKGTLPYYSVPDSSVTIKSFL